MSTARSSSFALLPLAVAGVLSLAPEPVQAVTFPSLTSRVLSSYGPTPEARTAPARVAAAKALIAGVDDTRRPDLVKALGDPERSKWTNVPPRMDDEGLRLGDCTEAELRLALDLLATSLSDYGYARVRDILLGDDELLANGKPRPGFGAENFWLVLFGEPRVDGEWGLQLDGHHLALNLSFAGERMTMSPTFLGAQPSRFTRGEVHAEPLADVQRAAHALVGALDEAQRVEAVVGARRGRNVAAAGRDGFVPEREGLACADLTDAQRALVLGLTRCVLRDLPADAAEERITALCDEVSEMHFSWRGPIAPGSDASFRLQGPSLILEYACQDLGGNPLDHLHVMVRDPSNEYGAGFE